MHSCSLCHKMLQNTKINLYKYVFMQPVQNMCIITILQLLDLRQIYKFNFFLKCDLNS